MLDWKPWDTGKEIPEDVPVDTLILVRLKGRREYSTAYFFTNSQGHKLGTVGDVFHWDREVLEWCVLQHLVEPEHTEPKCTSCGSSNITWNTDYQLMSIPPQYEGSCNECGEVLYKNA